MAGDDLSNSEEGRHDPVSTYVLTFLVLTTL